MKSEELFMLLIIGGGIILPIMGIGIAISRVTYKNERRFRENDLKEDVKRYIGDDGNRRKFSTDDRLYYKNKRKKRIKKIVPMILYSLIAILWMIDARGNMDKVSYAVPVLIISLIVLLCWCIAFIIGKMRAPKVNEGWVIKGYIYKYIRSNHRHIQVYALIIYYDYIEMKYKTYEVNTKRIRLKENDEKTGAEYVELICKEKKHRLQIMDVLS
ncbi:MAG: hypothetical protein Q4D51_03085 [Eubacteriales bacterium]|nr:hypothetical protein [Eubacteriales bacterium]